MKSFIGLVLLLVAFPLLILTGVLYVLTGLSLYLATLVRNLSNGDAVYRLVRFMEKGEILTMQAPWKQ